MAIDRWDRGGAAKTHDSGNGRPRTASERLTQAEIEVFERWFGDLFDELFGPDS